jgi:hypothetical protein
MKKIGANKPLAKFKCGCVLCANGKIKPCNSQDCIRTKKV